MRHRWAVFSPHTPPARQALVITLCNSCRTQPELPLLAAGLCTHRAALPSAKCDWLPTPWVVGELEMMVHALCEGGELRLRLQGVAQVNASGGLRRTPPTWRTRRLHAGLCCLPSSGGWCAPAAEPGMRAHCPALLLGLESRTHGHRHTVSAWRRCARGNGTKLDSQPPIEHACRC